MKASARLLAVLWAALAPTSLSAQEAAPATTPCPDGRVAVSGTAVDAVTGEGVAGAEVRAVRGGEAAQFWTARARPDGSFRLCVPRGEESVRLRASYGQKRGGAVELVPSADRSGVYLEVPLTEAQDLAGTVYDDVRKRPVHAAVVTLEPLGVNVFTDQEGRFRFPALPVGRYELRVEAPAYRPFGTSVLVRDLGRGAERLLVTLQPEAYELDPLVVEVMRQNPYLEAHDLYARMESDRGGLFLTEELLEQPVWRGARVDDVLEFNWEAARRLRNCSAIWVDGEPLRYSGLDLETTATRHILAIEVLAAGEAPLRYLPDGYTGSITSCGAVLIWTRRGEERWLTRDRR